MMRSLQSIFFFTTFNFVSAHFFSGWGSGWRGGKKRCDTVLEFFSNDTTAAFLQNNAIGFTSADVPIYERTTEDEVGSFVITVTDLNNAANAGGSQRYEDGFITLYEKGTTTPEGIVFTMAARRSGGGDVAIVGGTGAYGCAEGALKFVEFADGKFQLDLVLCGGLCPDV